VPPAAITERIRQAVEQSIQIIERRVNELGTVEPLIQREGVDRILVQVPGLQDPTRLKELLGKTAKMDFRMVDTTMPPDQARQAACRRIPKFCPAPSRRTRPTSSRSRCWFPAAI
jgi:preprotein translocase subunit SecD